jgi:hypothetical protein
MTVIRRKECPVHGPDFGIPTPSTMFAGREWCQHCRLPGNVLHEVEYVCADPLREAERLLKTGVEGNMTGALEKVREALGGD